MGIAELHHYSPVFANQRWSKGSRYVCYYRDRQPRKVVRTETGRRQWGRLRRLYKTSVEEALGGELETPVSAIYSALLGGQTLDAEARLKWAQFLRSQLVRTPSFMRYEETALRLTGIEDEPRHDRVGCEECLDLRTVTTRDWTILVAHEDDFFIRADNPVHVTGFLTLPRSVVFYPLSPRCCFVACSAADDWAPLDADDAPDPSHTAFQLGRGGAHIINFYLAKAADESVIVHPDHDGELTEAMLTEVLGIYPQVPFDIHVPPPDEVSDARESLRQIMSIADGLEYPAYETHDIEPYFEPTRRFTMAE